MKNQPLDKKIKCKKCSRKISPKNSCEESRLIEMCNKCFNKLCDDNERLVC